MAGFTVTLIGVAVAGLLGVVHVHWKLWVRGDQRLTKQSSNPEFNEQKGNVGSCFRILRVSFGCFPRVNWHQNSQKHLPNIPPTSSQNSSQALPTSSLSSHAFQGLILRTYGENSWKKHGEPEEKNPHFLCTRLILDLQNYRGSWNQIYNITGAFCTALNVEAAVKVRLDARERSPCNPVIEIQHSTLQVSFKTRSRPSTTCLGVQSWCTVPSPLIFHFNPLTGTRPHSNRPLYSNTAIGTLAVDGSRVGCYIWHSEEGPQRAAAPPSPSSLYQM